MASRRMAEQRIKDRLAERNAKKVRSLDHIASWTLPPPAPTQEPSNINKEKRGEVGQKEATNPSCRLGAGRHSNASTVRARVSPVGPPPVGIQHLNQLCNVLLFGCRDNKHAPPLFRPHCHAAAPSSSRWLPTVPRRSLIFGRSLGGW